MKTIDSVIYAKFKLDCLIEEKENGKAFVSYFINGDEITDWGSIKPLFQNLFTALADEMCDKFGLVKWSY